jgi:hypothetical protein
MADGAERWRDVPGWPYQASSEARIRNRYAQVLRARPDKDGYPQVTVRDGRRRRTVRVHVLVALAFHGQPPKGKPEVRHLDGDRGNSRPWNLRWGTRRDNERDKRFTAEWNRTDVSIRTGSLPSADGWDT